jgi:hypothetical protein
MATVWPGQMGTQMQILNPSKRRRDHHTLWLGAKESPSEENYKESPTEENYNGTAQEETLLTEGTHDCNLNKMTQELGP